MPVTTGRSGTEPDIGELYAAHRLSLVRLAVLLYDAGLQGSLPALLPMNAPGAGAITPGTGTWRQGTTSLHLEEGPVHARSELDQVYDLVGTIDGHHVSARAGVFNPMLLTSTWTWPRAPRARRRRRVRAALEHPRVRRRPARPGVGDR